MLRNLVSHLAQLWRFNGREGVAAFWTYAMFVIIGLLWAMMAAMMPVMARMMAKASEIARSHPEDVTVSSGPGNFSVQIHGYHPELQPDFSDMTGAMMPIMVVAIILLAAAVTRRLHDGGRRGWWGLLPLPFLFAGLYLMPRISTAMMAAPNPDLTAFFALFVNNVVYLALLGLLIYFLIKPGDGLANRYGEPPANSGRL